MGHTVAVEVPEEFLPGQLLAASHELRQSAIAHAELVVLARLPPKPELDVGAVDDGMATSQCRQPE